MRGKVGCWSAGGCPSRITPAYAGKSIPVNFFVFMLWDHPRLCGEKMQKKSVLRNLVGSPPPMRGKGTVSRTSGSFVGITPAYAGKSLFCFCCRSLFWDHPRLCGEKRSFRAVVCKRTGSPPPMRGKGSPVIPFRAFLRITPAYAGKSREPRQADTCEWDHPRLCGEKD